MKKSFKMYFVILLALLCSFVSITYYATAFNDAHWVQDAANTKKLPHHFRKCTDEIEIPSGTELNLTGLDTLRISGSSQFAENSLGMIKNSIGTNYSIITIDLRQESHGFINGTAVSLENEKNNANAGLTLEEVIKTENKDLNSIKLNEPLLLFNTQKEIIPKYVLNEASLTEDNSIGYLRIPVTDGKLPTEDMIVYFITFVNNQPENSWLHFHCKAGVGRTTTFMIMYDIMKNCNDVSLYDIITRQVILSKINEKAAAGFYKGEHFDFLNNFYTNYKNGCYDDKCSLSCYSNLNFYCSTNKNSYTDSYIKNSIIPKSLYVISEDKLTLEEKTMAATLQGIVAAKSDKQIYIISSQEPDYKVWLLDLKNNNNVELIYPESPWELLTEFSSLIDGYVLYNGTTTPSINNACTVASLKNSIAIDQSIENKVISAGVTTLIEDCRNTDKYWAFKNLWNSGLNHSVVIQLSPDKPISLRDYAITAKALIFYEDEKETDLRKTIFSSLDDNSHCLGWGPDEHNNVALASSHGVDVIAADWSYNLSVLSSFPLCNLKQKTETNFTNYDNVHYVTIIMSDGDNQQWLLGNNYTSNKWYGSPVRGQFNLGWSLSPALYYLAPTVFNQYYKSASTPTFNDNFLVPPSGNGYMYPSKFPIEKLFSYTNILNNYMKSVDQHNVLIIDDDSFYNNNLWDKYTCHSNIDGLFYLNYSKHHIYNGEIRWSNNKPIVSCRDLLWSGLEDEAKFVKNIEERISLGYTNPSSPNAYSFLYVHVWSNTMDNVKNVIDKLDSNPKVKIVTPYDFIRLIKQNVKPT